MLKVIDQTWTQGDYTNFRDLGYINVGGKTKKWSVTSRVTGAVLGYIKWYGQWRKYCFFSVDAIYEEKCLTDIATFVKMKTEEHREKTGWYKRVIKSYVSKKEREEAKLKLNLGIPVGVKE